jgi:hypothetical protein
LFIPIDARLDQIAAPELSVFMNDQKISNLGKATLLTDAPNYTQLQEAK